ncbi:putative cAMP-regulated D2 protein [Rosellinia necatrix]|uniref:Carboxylic ester hydrolase n=1 Tax=Rosellinia necatrix TaxID=77044 RepID=A0A1W2TK20_ROSNE|nr:putative cAMP-regulated D2 protein [Rosellinia necatrix]
MRIVLSFCLITFLVAFDSQGSSCKGEDDTKLTVKASTGRYTGLRDPEYGGVRVFRNIPYAKPPVGKLRWKPPVALRPSNQHHYSYRFPPPCPQYLSKSLSLWNSNITNFSISPGDQSYHAGEMAQTSAEDCLSLAIWTPVNATRKDKLPVGLFVPGGSFRSGGLGAPYYNPARWINRSRRHIMVTINYRVNIFGFPNAVGLETQNLGILDQRMALEWVYRNIEAFGGDQKRITLWGHSAGALSVDILNFAHPSKPLAAAFFLMSGTAMRKFAQGDNALQTNFSFVAKKLGCDFPQDAQAELECMQQVPVTLISNFAGRYGDDHTKPSLFFRPTADNKTIYENYTDRALQGLISRVPALVSTTSNEQSSLIEYPINNLIGGPNKTAIDKGTLSDFICPAYNTSNVRTDNELTTYRYEYVGNFSNITPYPWMGAYHGADLPMIFGTYNISGGTTEFQEQVAQQMQDYVFAFLTDPHNGLTKLGWLPSGGSKKGDAQMVRLGSGDGITKNISSIEVDSACMGIGPSSFH